ncbi:hypothetical protein [Geodermatophilus sp. SYSU D01119]
MGSKGTVIADLQALRNAGRLADVDGTVGLDGRRRASRTGASPVSSLAGLTVDLRTATLVARAADGLTVHDLCTAARKAKVPGCRLCDQGAASASLSRAVRAGLVRHSGTFRDGCTVYVAP